MFKFFLYKFGEFWVTLLPLDVSYRIAGFISTIQYYCSPRDRKAVKNNLKIILRTNQGVSDLAKEMFRNFGKYLVEFFRMAKEIDREFIKDRVKIVNLDSLKKALERKKGAILVTAHIGNWELGGVVLGVLGFPLVAIAMPHKERPVNDLFNRQREEKGVAIIPMQHAMRRCLSALKENKVVALLSDRDFTANGMVIDFLGRKTLIPKGAAVFAAKTGAAIVPCFLIREKENTFTLTLEEPFYPPHTNRGHINDETLLSIMRKYAAIIESKIRQYPSQWLMFRPFWIDETPSGNP